MQHSTGRLPRRRRWLPASRRQRRLFPRLDGGVRRGRGQRGRFVHERRQRPRGGRGQRKRRGRRAQRRADARPDVHCGEPCPLGGGSEALDRPWRRRRRRSWRRRSWRRWDRGGCAAAATAQACALCAAASQAARDRPRVPRGGPGGAAPRLEPRKGAQQPRGAPSRLAAADRRAGAAGIGPCCLRPLVPQRVARCGVFRRLRRVDCARGDAWHPRRRHGRLRTALCVLHPRPLPAARRPPPCRRRGARRLGLPAAPQRTPLADSGWGEAVLTARVQRQLGLLSKLRRRLSPHWHCCCRRRRCCSCCSCCHCCSCCCDGS